MSDQYVLSRRKAIALLGASAVSMGAVARQPNAATAATSTDEVATPARPQYIFGYGSLMQRESRMKTWAGAEFASPVIVKGVSRGWFDQTGGPSWSPTYLGAVLEKDAICNGVIFPVSPESLSAYNQREVGYEPARIDASQISTLDGSPTPEGDVWFYGNKEKKLPSSDHPIVQSYVDVCLDGCLEIEALYPLARQGNFAEQFIKTTSDWQPPWINDRIYPWRPFVYVPRAAQIDALIQEVLGAEMFAKITLK
ncbi:MAG TPA: gamma-glutamylcyclotransferase family protein [Terrimicrobiaceae bacterium]|nr:gamma-glutamylcyclotransferase family protein [Terrimicrobiaceae bacterium]